MLRKRNLSPLILIRAEGSAMVRAGTRVVYAGLDENGGMRFASRAGS